MTEDFMTKSGQHGGNRLQMAQQYGFQPDEILDFSANINPLGLPDGVRQAMIAGIRKAEHYPDIDYTHLYEQIAGHYQLDTSELVVGNGATELIYDWIAAHHPRKALLLEPSFSEYRRALMHSRCDIVTVPLSESLGFVPDKNLLDHMTRDIDCMILCTPNNPTGIRIDSALLLAILDRAETQGIAVMIDESFIDFIPGERGMLAIRHAYPGLSILRSLTKIFAMPGVRLGFLVSHNRDTIATLRQQQKPWSINAFATIAGETVFSDPDYLARTYQWLDNERPFLLAGLKRYDALQVWASSANYLFFKCNDASLDLQDALMTQRILIRSCANYPQLNSQFYRIAIRSHAENCALLEALHRIFPHG